MNHNTEMSFDEFKRAIRVIQRGVGKRAMSNANALERLSHSSPLTWGEIEQIVADHLSARGLRLYTPGTTEHHEFVKESIDRQSATMSASFTENLNQAASAEPLYRDSVRDAKMKQIADNLTEWWNELSAHDLERVLPKAVEYGSVDLEIMGVAMGGLFHRSKFQYPVNGVEMAIAFYLLGKVSRLWGAYENGQNPSDDTWLDISTYAMMGRRVRAVGGWPE